MRVLPRPIRLAVIAMAALPALGGCEGFDWGGLGQAPPPTQHRPPPPAETGKAQASRTPAPPTPRPAPLPEIKLVGLTQAETEELLGPPAASSEQAPAKVWQYRAGDCAVDVYFYLDVARNDFYALHYDTPDPAKETAGGTPSEAANRCLRRVYNARHR